MSNNPDRPSSIVLGLALFSMFFGSGNLIFPLFLGQLAREEWMTAFGGFLITAVGLPLLGVLVMVLYAGNYRIFFAQLGRPTGLLLTTLLLTIWIPLGSAPRCIALSYASLQTYLQLGPLWLYAIVYSALAALIVAQRRRMLTILGSYLTPALLVSLFAIVIYGWLTPSSTLPVSHGVDSKSLFLQGIVEGYNTMDLIASFFFSASIIGMLHHASYPLKSTLSLVLKAGTIAAVILAVVYISLLYTAAIHHPLLLEIPKEQMLAHLAKVFLGEHLGATAAVAIGLACLTTSVALINVFTEFLRTFGISYGGSLVATSLVSYAMALTGLEGITAVTAPILQVCYPLLLLIIVYSLLRRTLSAYTNGSELVAVRD